MPDPSANFPQARLKHRWANRHIVQLNDVWQWFLKSDFCKLAVEDNADGKGQTLRVVSISPLPAELLLILGDAIHNLRCALDYVVNDLLSSRDTRLTFPMGKEREELVDSFRTKPETIGGRTKKKGRNAAIEKAIPGIGAFIVDELRPYEGSGELLWPLGRLDARDKHRLLIPVLIPQTIGGINAVDANNNRIVNCSVTVGSGGIANLATFGAGGVKIESWGKTTAEMFFDDADTIKDQGVLPVLAQMSHAVEQTIDRIDDFATAAGWTSSRT